MERDTLDPSYSSFLIRFGGKDVRVIDAIAPMRRGGCRWSSLFSLLPPLSFLRGMGGVVELLLRQPNPTQPGGTLNREMFLEWAREQQLNDVSGVLFGLHHHEICGVIHPGTNCISVKVAVHTNVPSCAHNRCSYVLLLFWKHSTFLSSPIKGSGGHFQCMQRFTLRQLPSSSSSNFALSFYHVTTTVVSLNAHREAVKTRENILRKSPNRIVSQCSRWKERGSSLSREMNRWVSLPRKSKPRARRR